MKCIVINRYLLSLVSNMVRCHIIAIGLCCLSLIFTPRIFANDYWLKTSPDQVNISADLGEKLVRSFEHGELKNLHSVLVVRDNKIAIEKYFQGEDQIWGRSIGEIKFDKETLHDLRSISKSIVSLLYGIALDEKKVPDLNEPIIDSFSEYPGLATKDRLDQIKIHHMLSMTMGLKWDESLPYSNPDNSEIAMERASDRYHYILSQNIVFAPGDKWEYSGGSTALTAGLLKRSTDKGLFEYAKQKLFDPLGIDAQWTKGFDGEESAASGLRMRPRDLAKIGQLILNEGKWDGKLVVSKSWLDASFKQHAQTGDGLFYGYQWWLGTMSKDGSPWISGFGNGSQRLIIVPSLDMVVVIMAGNYNQPQQWKLPVKIMSEFIVPAIEDY